MNSYQIYNKAISAQPLPSAYIDMDLLDENIQSLLERSGNKPIRIATKSIRSLPMLKYLASKSDTFIGFMAFTLLEACFLADNGLDNILMGYPSMQESALKEVGRRIKDGKRIVLMVDRMEHLGPIEKVAKELECRFLICIDTDVSTRFPGLYFGVHRSAVKGKDDFAKMLNGIIKSDYLDPAGLMGYEAQIAGVVDNQKGNNSMNLVTKVLKRNAIPKIATIREELVATFKELTGLEPAICNAGGTGSIESSIQESWVNEITIGSGFFQPALFDSYRNFLHKPAAFFALEVVRNPKKGIYTLNGGGYIASGDTNKNKLPQPFLPKGMSLIKREGAGEVQTPVRYNGILDLGTPVFFRHAKAGELCERFNTIYLIRGDKISDEFKTYRGDGFSFL